MTVKKVDPRVVKTRHNLRRALIYLMQDESVDTISVQQITEKAHVTRGTFYLHYRDKQDFLKQALTDLCDELFDEVLRQETVNGPKRCSLPRLFAYIEQNADVFGVLLSTGAADQFEELLTRRFKQAMVAYLNASKGRGKQYAVPVELQINYLVAAVLGLITSWLTGGLVYTSHYMAANTAKMIAADQNEALPLAKFFDTTPIEANAVQSAW